MYHSLLKLWGVGRCCPHTFLYLRITPSSSQQRNLDTTVAFFFTLLYPIRACLHSSKSADYIRITCGMLNKDSSFMDLHPHRFSISFLLRGLQSAFSKCSHHFRYCYLSSGLLGQLFPKAYLASLGSKSKLLLEGCWFYYKISTWIVMIVFFLSCLFPLYNLLFFSSVGFGHYLSHERLPGVSGSHELPAHI